MINFRKYLVSGLLITSSLASIVFVALAADGSGTNTVTPNTTTASSTGGTHTFTYTASETMDSGSIDILVPAGWSAPQGTNGVAGYTTVTSTGTIADIKNTLDTATNWTATNHMTLSADTGDKPSDQSPTSTASLSNNISSYAGANEQWYFNNGAAQNWGGIDDEVAGLRVGMFIKSSVATSAGNLSWQNDDTANLASPLDTVNIVALTANTWTYTSVTLGSLTRNSILSYGLRYTTDIGAAIVKLDSIATLFDAAGGANWDGDSNITASQLNTAGNFKEGTASVRCTYASGAGTGTSGDCFRSSSSVTMGPGTTVGLWVRSSINLNAGDFDWVDDGSNNIGSPEDSVDLPALTANTWTYVTITAANSANKSANSWGIRQIVDKGAMTIDVDALGKIINTTDTTTGWTAPTSSIHTLASDTGVKQEGTASLRNTITSGATAGDKWYETYGSAQNWSAYTRAGFWIRSTVATSAGQLQFEYDDATDLSSPIATINIGALSANTWTYQNLALTGTRTSVSSYGIKYTTDIGAATVYLDYFLLGPGSPIFTGSGPWHVNVPLLALSGTQTVTVTYGAGGGVSGVTAPSTSGVHTFTTQSRTSVAGTLTNIATHPTITVIPNAPGIPDMTAGTDSGTSSTDNITNDTTPDFTISCITGSAVQLFDNLTLIGSGTCVGGTVTITSSALSSGVHSSINAKQDGSVASGNLSITIDNTADAAPGIPDMTSATDSGTSSTDNITNDTTPNFTISCVTGSTVTLFDNITSVGTGTCVGGTVTITASTLSQGTHATMNARQTDPAGNQSVASGNLSIVIDSSLPTLAEVTPVPTPGTDTTPNYTFSSTEGGTITYGGDCSSPTTTASVGNNTITFNALSVGTHSNCTITVTDTAGNISSVLNISSFTINPAVGPLDHFAFTTISSPQTAGTAFSVTITAQDASNNTVTSFTGTVDLTTNAGSITPTVSGAFTAGVRTQSVTVTQAGTLKTITATRTGGSETGTSNTFTVNAGALDHFVVTNTSDGNIGTQTGGTPFNIKIVAKDANNNTVTSFASTVALSNFLGGITPTTSSAFTAGVLSSQSVTLANAGTDSITATSGGQNGTSNSFTVNSPALDHFDVTNTSNGSIGNQTAGVPFNIKIVAKDSSNNTVTSFTGTVTLSNALGGISPTTSASFSAGVLLSQSVTLTTAGTDSITATSGSESGTSNNFTVSAGPTAQFTIDDPGDMVAGTRIGYTVTRKDQFGNLVTAGSDTVYLYTNSTGTFGDFFNASSGGSVISSVNITAGNSSAQFWYEEGTAGNWTVTVSDDNSTPDGNVGIDDASDPVIVSAGPTAKFILNDPGDMTVATRLQYAVTRYDEFDNLVTSGTDTVYLYTTSTSPTAGFYNVSSGGSLITSISIPNLSSSENFWYFDDLAGTWTITASDNSSTPDGTTGINDSTDSVTVSNAPIVATKFIIEDPLDGTVGDIIQVTIRAVNGSNALDTTYQSDVTLNTSGSAVGGGVVDIVNGIGTMNITDNTAETVNLSLSDTQGTGLDVTSTQNVVFSPGPVAEYSIDNPGDMVAGTRIGYTVTRKDEFGNLVTAGTSTVYLYTDSTGSLGLFYDAPSGGSLISSVNITPGNSSTQFWYEEGTAGNWIVTVSDNNSAPDGNNGIDDASDSVLVTAGATAKFILNDPGNMTVGTRLGYTVTRKDQFDNLVTSGTDTVYLYSNSTGAEAFYATSSGGSPIASIDISSGSSSVNFWYFDNLAGTWTITVSDDNSSPDGNSGIDDSSDQVVVSTNPIVATKIVIETVADTTVGTTFGVVIKAKDNSDNVDTTYNNSVTLVASGHVSGAGVVNIVNGVGGINLTATSAGTVTLSLSDTNSTGLNVSSTEVFIITAIGTPPPPSSPTPPPPAPSEVIFEGIGFPGGRVNVLSVPTGNISQGISVGQETIPDTGGDFQISVTDPDVKSNLYVLIGYDKNGNSDRARIFTNVPDEAVFSNIFFAPTLVLNRSSIRQGDFFIARGSAYPLAVLELEVDNLVFQGFTAKATADGSYSFLVNSSNIAFGKHSLRVRQAFTRGESDFSLSKAFNISDILRPIIDFNDDGVIDIRDINIFRTTWFFQNEDTRARIDLNNDLKVDISDLSIFVQLLKRR